MHVRDMMTINVITVREEQTVEDGARLLAQHRISGLPVVNADNRVVGLVSELDLLSKPGKTIADVMTRNVISVSPDTEADHVRDIFTSRRIRRVPVIEHDQLVGIVSRADLVKQMAMRWVCHVCGESVRSANVPERCPACGAGHEAFSYVTVMPGM